VCEGGEGSKRVTWATFARSLIRLLLLRRSRHDATRHDMGGSHSAEGYGYSSTAEHVATGRELHGTNYIITGAVR